MLPSDVAVRRWARARLLKVTRCRASWLETGRADPFVSVWRTLQSRTGNGGYLWSGIVHPSWVGILIASLGSQRRLVVEASMSRVSARCMSTSGALRRCVSSSSWSQCHASHDKCRLEAKPQTTAEVCFAFVAFRSCFLAFVALSFSLDACWSVPQLQKLRPNKRGCVEYQVGERLAR